MSVEWYLQCNTHTPPLAEHFEGISRSDLEKSLIPDNRAAIIAIPEYIMEHRDYSETRHWPWIRQHALCSVTMVNEYDQTLAEWEKDKKC